MSELIQVFLDIARWRKGPEDLPASGFLLIVTLAGYLFVSIATVLFYAKGVADLLAQITLDVALMFGFFGFLLVAYRKWPRFEQTMTALLGTGIVLTIVALPLMAWLRIESNDTQASIPALMMFVVVLWSISVTGHIMRRSLEIPFVGGVVLAVGHFLLSVFAFARFFPAETG
jgi:hypothetical protein